MHAFLRKLWVFLRPYQFRLFVGLVYGCCFAPPNTALTFIVKWAPDVVFSHDGAASQRVFELLETPNSVKKSAAAKSLCTTGAEIRFEGVEFNCSDKTVLRRIDLTIRPGLPVALVAQSGSDKTTLSNLLLRFCDPQGRVITIGGTDIRDVSTSQLRSQMAVVTQGPVLFNETVRWAIGEGHGGASAAEIEQTARHAHANDFMMEKPGSFETVVGEMGVLLSGGQHQGIALARAVLRNAPILILDEVTSSLEELMQVRITIWIAHRLWTIQRADQNVVLDAGRVAEIGTHAEVLQRQGHCARLHSLRFETGGTPPAST